MDRRDDTVDRCRPGLANPGIANGCRWSVEPGGLVVAADPARDGFGPRRTQAPFREVAERSARRLVREPKSPARARPRDDPASVRPVVARWMVESDRPLAWAIWVSVASSDSSSATTVIATGSVIKRSIDSRLLRTLRRCQPAISAREPASRVLDEQLADLGIAQPDLPQPVLEVSEDVAVPEAAIANELTLGEHVVGDEQPVTVAVLEESGDGARPGEVEGRPEGRGHRRGGCEDLGSAACRTR